MIRRLILWARILWDKVVYNERLAGLIRVLFFIFLTLTLAYMGYAYFEKVDTSTVEAVWLVKYNFPILASIVKLVIRFGYFLVYGFRFFIIPVGIFIGVYLASAYYVQDIYELPKYSSALRYVFSSFTSWLLPYLVIENGKKQIARGETNLIDIIGGPGNVLIRPGNVVLFESLRFPSSVRSNPFNRISRFETIREIVSLDDYHGFIESLMRTKTKDGIELTVRDVHFRYRLRTGKRYGDYEKRNAQEPYPYSVNAVKNMAYNRSVGMRGLTSWHDMITLRIDGGITDYIKEHTFDHLTAPTYEDQDPRKIISNKIMKGNLRKVLRNHGAELLWLDIGHFEVSDKMIQTLTDQEVPQSDMVADQRVDTWGARLDGAAMVVRAHGEARRMAYQEMGRAEGQADLLLSILQGLDEAGFEAGRGSEEERRESLRRIVWARIAQIFDAVAEEEKKNQSRNTLPPKTTKG